MISFTAVLALLCVANVIVARDPLDCVETAKRSGAINFVNALSESGLTDAVRRINSSTIFVPTNQAFLDLPDRFRQQFNDSKVYQQALLNHVINSTVAYADLRNEHEYYTLAGNNAQVRANEYNTSAANATTYKTINGARINGVSRDIQCGTDVRIHFVDELITSISTESLITIIQRNASFSYFVRLFNNASTAGQNLLKQAEGETVFIPDDNAFSKLPNGFFDNLVKNQTLVDDVIATHVIDSNVFFSVSLWDKRVLKSHNNKDLTVAYDPNQHRYTINGANFIDMDIAATNGVYHIVDTVLYKTSALKFAVDVEVL